MSFEKLNKLLDGRVEQDKPLAPLTSFGIGGPAMYFFEAKTPTDIIRGVRAARSLQIKFFILGGGSNILFDDAGYRGLIIKDNCDRFFLHDSCMAAQSGA